MQQAMCHHRETLQLDQALNKVYRELRAMLKADDPLAERALVEAQRAWLAFREKEQTLCAVTRWSRDGSQFVQVEAECRQEITEERLNKLRGYLRSYYNAFGG